MRSKLYLVFIGVCMIVILCWPRISSPEKPEKPTEIASLHFDIDYPETEPYAPQFNIAWESKQTGFTGRGTIGFCFRQAKYIANKANRECPEIKHWCEPVPTYHSPYINSLPLESVI